MNHAHTPNSISAFYAHCECGAGARVVNGQPDEWHDCWRCTPELYGMTRGEAFKQMEKAQ